MDEEKIDEILGDDVDEPIEPEKVDDTASKEAERIAELERINQGLLQAKVSSQASKGAIKEELDQTKEQMRALEEELKLVKGKVPVDANIEVEIDDDGNAFIPRSKLPDTSEQIKDLEAKLINATKAFEDTRAQLAEQEATKAFLSEKDGYQEAAAEVKEQWSYIKTELFDQFVASNGLEPPTTQAEALEITSLPGFQETFRKKFPDGDVESVMQAGLYGDRYYQRKALETVLKKKNPASAHEQIPGDKPLPIGTVSGASIQKDSDTLNRFADMPMEDFLKLTPEEERRMDRLLQG